MRPGSTALLRVLLLVLPLRSERFLYRQGDASDSSTSHIDNRECALPSINSRYRRFGLLAMICAEPILSPTLRCLPSVW
ncbi:hypothetical protein CPB83DRAFT_849541 [Crepidotus variabilis]|uniref:Secreted protein n=1 Tax=Crepidotus variabilis TaxID=179855 RepID=A0A9P6ELN3_9AGAR|nr:hypothetical protein CPB83DRAFT_849541 [Crepidotus variabilis]